MPERVVVSCYRILAVTSFVLKVRSWSGNNVPIYLYQMNVIFCHSCPLKRGQSLKAQLSSQRPWLGEAAPQPEGSSVCAQQAPARLVNI